MIIYGDRVKLRAIELQDNEMLLELINDPDTERMVGGYSQPKSLDDQIAWFKANGNDSSSVLRYIIADIKSDTALGTIILSSIDRKNGTANINIKMSKTSGRGKGFATDAVKALLAYSFNELRLNCIYAHILDYNEPSIKLFERCGLTKEGTLRERVFKDGSYHNQYVYSILKSEFEMQ